MFILNLTQTRIQESHFVDLVCIYSYMICFNYYTMVMYFPRLGSTVFIQLHHLRGTISSKRYMPKRRISHYSKY